MPILTDFKKIEKKVEEISSRFDLSKRKKEQKIVEKIIEDVKKSGDKALFFYTNRFDSVNLKELKVKKNQINNSINEIPPELLRSIKNAILRIRNFQRKNTLETWESNFNLGEKMGYKYVPLDSVGIYIPGGKIPLISTVLMTVIPAQVSGVKRIVIFTPPPVHSAILAACKLLNIDEVYQIGGAQAIAASAYGTKSIKPVCKIVGPGNVYVTLAKKNVFGKIGIDGLFGPSEIAIIADKTANPEYLAWDLLSQLEHGSGLESAFMVTTDLSLAQKTENEFLKITKNILNKKTILNSWKKNSAIVVVKNLEIGIKLINKLAPEHLEIVTKNPVNISKKIKNAGAIFIGENTCESIGDYIAGPSHCLPTGGTARFSSGLTTSDFVKKISTISFPRKSLLKVAHDVMNLAHAEKLPAHAGAVRVRIKSIR